MPGLYIDNKSLVESLSSYKQVKDRRLRLDTTILENMVARDEIDKIFWVNSSEQLADCLTKKGVCTDKCNVSSFMVFFILTPSIAFI